MMSFNLHAGEKSTNIGGEIIVVKTFLQNLGDKITKLKKVVCNNRSRCSTTKFSIFNNSFHSIAMSECNYKMLMEKS